MSTYAIGDIQGCFDPLQALLEKTGFKPGKDKLWFTGDLINRGPDSLETLRFVKELGNSAVTVLGNHDLHFLAVAKGYVNKKADDTLDDILAAPDLKELVKWLRHQPLLHHDKQLGFTMIHAGLPPQWDFSLAKKCAHEVEHLLQGKHHKKFLNNMYGNLPDLWSDDLEGMDRYRFITNAFTRLRYCDKNGRLCLKAKGPVNRQKPDMIPWFDFKKRASKKMNIIFGHWSALGLHQSKGIHALDTGCLWGGKLTAMRLEDRKLFSIKCKSYRLID